MYNPIPQILKTRRERKNIERSTRIVMERQEQAYRFMNELEVAGYEIVKKTSNPN